MTNGSEQDFKPYYNVPLPTAVQSALDAPSSLSSECASEEPARPPRTRDDGNNVPSYCNLPSEGGRGEQAQPPMLPRRQPHLRASPVALRNQPPPPPPPPLPSAPPPTSAHPPRQHIFHFPPSSSSSRDKFSCGHSTASTTASPTLRLPVYQNYRKRSSVIGRSRTLAGTGRRGPAATGCQCGKSGAAAPATESAAPAMQTTTNTVILLYSRHCPGSIEWAKYLHKLFTELSKHKGKLRVRHLPIEDLASHVLPPSMEEGIYQSRLQLVLLSPNFLSFVAKNPSTPLGRLLHPDRVLAVMLGVKDNQILPEHRSALSAFSQWIHLEAKDHDLEFVQTVLYFSTQILNRTSAENGGGGGGATRTRSVRRPQSLNAGHGFSATARMSGDNSSFHIHPKKITENHSRLIVCFETPQSSRSHIRIRLERRPSTAAASGAARAPHASDVELEEWRFLNPYNVQATVPARCFTVTHLARVRVEVDGLDRGARDIKLESPLGELDQLLRVSMDPVLMMCQALGVNPNHGRAELDEKLARNLLAIMPKSGGLCELKLFRADARADVRDEGEFPTLLHFAACHGLVKLVSLLMECPGSNIAVEMKNGADMSPAEMAQSNGHFELAERLFSFQASAGSLPHIYDYIQQEQARRATEAAAAATLSKDPVAPQPTALSEYQVPPPPRPVEGSAFVLAKAPYLDMSGSGSGSATPADGASPKTERKAVQTGPAVGQKSDDSPKYHEIKSPCAPAAKDPFGTMRAASRLPKEEEDDDVFLPSSDSAVDADASKVKRSKEDPFGTLRANKAIRMLNEKRSVPSQEQRDYRGDLQKVAGYENELAITNELLCLLEDFKNKSYTVKEMEVLFDKWRRRAAIYDFPDKAKSSEFEELKEKLKKYKSNSTLMRLFNKSHNLIAAADGVDNQSLKSSKPAKVYKRPSTPKQHANGGPNPVPGNETIIESELSVINEGGMSVVVVPPTPRKASPQTAEADAPPTMGISSQILPLSRLSLSSGGGGGISPTSSQDSSNDNRDRANGDTSSSSADSGTPPSEEGSGDGKDLKSWPVKDKLIKLRKSFTEPLVQYFQELQMTPSENEEPEVLNTPKSLAASRSNICGGIAAHSTPKSAETAPEVLRPKRNIFPALESHAEAKEEEAEDDQEQERKYENMPPIIITDM